ncbi:hypothetical protein [Thalassotalea sp. ND16A]|uniref:hypothetical protein n=1 Tax=Thalassotalea sp. ND16A TaxID=1535422 RepID=UPI00051A037F|nr:hypothetical protein [Thalassotalea sp. ND16A]KGK00283.1 hypothetical protein ND16A_3619 [Thalassotalea sp. ND16A]
MKKFTNIFLIACFMCIHPLYASTCVNVDVNGFLVNSGVPIDQCNDLVLLDATEYNSINVDSIVATLIDLFQFSAEDMGAFVATCIITFITGHGVGRVVRILGKS